jgi:hypothetical protein
MSRGLGWVESLVFRYLQHRGGSASFDTVMNHALMYGEYASYRSHVESVRRALKSLGRRGLVEKEVYKGVVIYTAKTDVSRAQGGLSR